MANLVNEQELFFTAFEPKTANRYIMLLDGIPSYLIKKADRPKITQEKKRLDHINLQRYIKGKTVWDEIDLLLTSNPALLLEHPEDKIIIKYQTEYNKHIKSDNSICFFN